MQKMTDQGLAISLSDSAAVAQSDEVARRIALTRQAQKLWAAKSVRERLQVVRRFRRLLADNALTLADQANGHSRAEVLSSQVLPLADACRFLHQEGEGILAPRNPSKTSRPAWLGGVKLTIYREPLGLILVIAPANYPVFLPGVQTLQALVAGNAVILKPGRGGQPAAQTLAKLLTKAGLDPRLFSLLPEAPEAATAALKAGVDKVVFTGSAATGRAILQDMAPHLVPGILELAGCDAVFIREDADVDQAAKALAFGLRLNASATCIAPRRVFVQRSIAATLEVRLARLLADFPGVPVEPALAIRVCTLAREAIKGGARLLTGKLEPTTTLKPLILTDVPPASQLLRADLFAPVLALMPFTDDDEALRLAAVCPYALGATVFGRNTKTAYALARKVRAGLVIINDMIVPSADPRVPFGGRGESGFGVTRGAEGLLELTAVKAIANQSNRRPRHLEPPMPGDENLFRAYIAFAHGSNRRRFGTLRALIKALIIRIRNERTTLKGIQHAND
jgi:acyl-CoA reductase-like NAD-dependent aldehyde dehydrogenase